jgi:hypothetical protein
LLLARIEESVETVQALEFLDAEVFGFRKAGLL